VTQIRSQPKKSARIKGNTALRNNKFNFIMNQCIYGLHLGGARADRQPTAKFRWERMQRTWPGMVAAAPQNKQPFVLHKNRLYLQRYFHYETMMDKKEKV